MVKRALGKTSTMVVKWLGALMATSTLMFCNTANLTTPTDAHTHGVHSASAGTGVGAAVICESGDEKPDPPPVPPQNPPADPIPPGGTPKPDDSSEDSDNEESTCICHVTPSRREQYKCLPTSAVEAHLAHLQDYAGPCDGRSNVD